MRITHNPVCEVFNKFITEFHLLAEGQIIATGHHRFYQLTQFRFDVYGVNSSVQMANITK